jgi:hypothetical protein
MNYDNKIYVLQYKNTMVHCKTQTAVKLVMLNAENTKLFLKDIDEVCKNLDFLSLLKTFEKYPFKNINLDEYSVFIEQAKYEINFWYDDPLDIKIKSVEEYDSKCIFCSIGKTVKAYNIKYLKMKDESLPGRIVYKKSFAINFEIIDNELIDFSWCNKFLDINETISLSK